MTKNMNDGLDGAGGQHCRQNSYDLLRLMSTVAVIFIHANWKYFSHVFDAPELSADWIFLSLMNIVTRFSVPCFVMLSGAFILQNSNNRNYSTFYQKSIKKIILPTVGAIVILFAAQITVNKITGKGDSLAKLVIDVVHGEFHNLWYIYMLVGLYFLAPYIIRLKENLSWKQYKVLSFVMMIWAVVSQVCSSQRLAYAIGVVFAFLGYFLMGDVIRYEIANGWNPNKIALVVICMLCVTGSFAFRYLGHNYYIAESYINFFSPTIMVYSICIFSIFGSINMQRSFGSIVGLTFELYLFHTIILNGISPLLLERGLAPALGELFIVVATFVVSMIVAFLYKKLWLMIMKRTKIEELIGELKVWKTLV